MKSSIHAILGADDVLVLFHMELRMRIATGRFCFGVWWTKLILYFIISSMFVPSAHQLVSNRNILTLPFNFSGKLITELVSFYSFQA